MFARARTPTLYRRADWLGFGIFACFLAASMSSVVVVSLAPQLGPLGLSGVFVVVMAAGCWRLQSMGLVVASGELQLVGTLGRRRVPTNEVSRFELRPGAGGSKRLHVCLRDGEALAVPVMCFGGSGLFRSKSLAWDGGETQDILGRLEHHLAAEQSTEARAHSEVARRAVERVPEREIKPKARAEAEALVRKVRRLGLPAAVSLYPIVWWGLGPGHPGSHMSPLSALIIPTLTLAPLVGLERFLDHLSRKG